MFVKNYYLKTKILKMFLSFNVYYVFILVLKLPLPRKIQYIPGNQSSRRNSCLTSSDDEGEDKRRKVLERNR